MLYVAAVASTFIAKVSCHGNLQITNAGLIQDLTFIYQSPIIIPGKFFLSPAGGIDLLYIFNF